MGTVSIVTTQQAHDLEETAEHANLLGLAFQEAGVAIFEVLKPGLDL